MRRDIRALLVPVAIAFSLPFQGACSSDSTVALDSASVQQTLLGHSMVLPTGFSIKAFAQNLNGVRFMIQGPDGAIYASDVAGTKSEKITDANRDGVADGVTTVHSGLDAPHGMAFRGDT